MSLKFCMLTEDLFKLLSRFFSDFIASSEILMSVLFLVFSEYLAIFKKTVAMHEVFLCRVAAHPILRKDLNFHVFLEYNQDVSIENWIAGREIKMDFYGSTENWLRGLYLLEQIASVTLYQTYLYFKT